MTVTTARPEIRRRLVFACTIAATLLPALAHAPARAQQVERIEAVRTAPVDTLPAAGAMRERTWSQIVWDKAANRLARRVYTIQDPLGAEDFDLFWDGDAASRAADGPVTGTGTLVWREQGSPAYSQQHRVAVYSGSFRDGRAHGTGRFTHRSGLTYSGEWENGLMHGEGRIYFPNGDQYAGGFSAGLPQGEGIYIDTAGTIYDGGFASGVRSGSGSLYPANGAPFSAQWDDGQALSGSVRLLDPQEQRYPPVVWAQYARHDDIQVGVLVDRAYYAHVPGPGKPPIPTPPTTGATASTSTPTTSA